MFFLIFLNILMCFLFIFSLLGKRIQHIPFYCKTITEAAELHYQIDSYEIVRHNF